MIKRPIYFVPVGARLTFISKVDNLKAIYKCTCGTLKEINFSAVKAGKTKSCGCLLKEGNPKLKTHGLTNHPLYNKWCKIRSRCQNPKNKDYPLYGGRGVMVCEEWDKDFISFYNWCIKSGWKRGLELDKDYIPKKIGIDGKLYSPDTCCFLTQKENSNYRRNNKFISFNGRSLNITQWEQELGLNSGVLSQRLKKLGWSIEKALSTPMLKWEDKSGNVLLLQNRGFTIRQISSQLKMCRKTISKIIKGYK